MNREAEVTPANVIVFLRFIIFGIFPAAKTAADILAVFILVSSISDDWLFDFFESFFINIIMLLPFFYVICPRR